VRYPQADPDPQVGESIEAVGGHGRLRVMTKQKGDRAFSGTVPCVLGAVGRAAVGAAPPVASSITWQLLGAAAALALAGVLALAAGVAGLAAALTLTVVLALAVVLVLVGVIQGAAHGAGLLDHHLLGGDLRAADGGGGGGGAARRAGDQATESGGGNHHAELRRRVHDPVLSPVSRVPDSSGVERVCGAGPRPTLELKSEASIRKRGLLFKFIAAAIAAGQ
jgi:hypothetical protein